MEFAFEGGRLQTAAVVGGENGQLRAPEAKEAQGSVERAVTLIAGENANAGRAAQPLFFDVPAAAGKQSVASSRETGDVRHLAAADERKAGGGRNAENFFQPLAGNFFDDGCGRAAGVKRGVLIPSGGEPIGGESGGQRPADDPAEEASAGRAEDAPSDVGGEFGDDLGGWEAFVAKLFAEAMAQRREIGGGGNRGSGEIVEV